MGPLAASSILSSIECLHSYRELSVYDTLRKSKIALMSACSCCYHFLNVLVGVQFHWIFFFLFFFSIVFVPMIENGSWSMTFEEVSFFYLCVSVISVSVSEKCSILLRKVTYRTFPAVHLLCRRGGNE